MLGDELQQPTNYLVEIISPVSSIEKSDTHVVISEPILIYFFDKDSKEAAGVDWIGGLYPHTKTFW